MHISETIYWPVTCFMFIVAMLFAVHLFGETTSIAEYSAQKTNEKRIVTEDRSNTSPAGYQTRTLSYEGSQIISEVQSTPLDIKVIIHNASGYAAELTEAERKQIRNEGDISPITKRVNVNMQYTKKFSYDTEGALSCVTYEIFY